MLKKPFKAVLPAMLFVTLLSSAALVSCGSSEEKKEESTEVAPAAADTTKPASDTTGLETGSTRPVDPTNKSN